MSSTRTNIIIKEITKIFKFFVTTIEGWRCESLKKVSLMAERVKQRGDGVCEDVEGYFSIALMSLKLPSLGAGVTPMRWHRRA